VTELVVDARILVYRASVGFGSIDTTGALDGRLAEATGLVAPACELLRAYRLLRILSARGLLSPAHVTRLSMLICESGVELRPLWPWDVPRIAALRCDPHDAWCIAIAESLDVPLLTRNPELAKLGAACPVEVY
jgi:hypothetical protein